MSLPSQIPGAWRSLSWLPDVTACGGRAFAVGGAVRDWLRGEEPSDLDIVVEGIERPALARILGRYGRVDDVGASFAVLKWRSAPGAAVVDVALPRVERSTGPHHRDFELEAGAEVRLESDLARRDFTINAIAVDLDSAELVDPFHGRVDLEGRVLRAVGDARLRFQEDPLRILRGVGFVARFDLEVEPQTLAAMRGLRDGLAGLSCERVAGELVKLLMSSRRPSKGLRLLHEIGALAHVLPELLPSVGFAQNNPHHHLDVWQHVLLAVDTAAARGSGIAVRLAALLHDVAKPECYSEDTRPDGSVLGHFLGHELRSAEIADEILTRLRLRSVDGVPQDVPARVCRMVRHHLVAIDSGASERALRRFIHRVGGRQAALELLELWAADRSAHADGLDETEYERMVQRVAGAGDVPLSAHRLALGGGALATRFGLSGPAIGALKERLLEAVVAGDVENDEAALLRLAERLRGSVE